MSGRPDVSNMTQDQFESMATDNGDLRDPSYQESHENEEESEADEQEEAEEEPEESEEEPEGEDSDEVDWESVDPRYKAHYEKIAAEAQKWKSDHSKIQSQWTKASQAQKEFQETRAKLEGRDKQLSQIEALLEEHPHLVDLIDREIAKASNPLEAAEVPDYLKQDPAYQYIQKTYQPYVQGLEKKLNDFQQKFSKFDEFERSQAEAKHREALDSQLNAAKEAVKSMFGRDATEDDVTQVLQYMVDNKFYNNGKAAAMAVFGDQYEKAIAQKQQMKMKEKAGKFPSRNKSISSSRVRSEGDMDSGDAVRAAIAEFRGN